MRNLACIFIIINFVSCAITPFDNINETWEMAFDDYAQESDHFFNLQWKAGETEIYEAHVGDEITIKFETMDIPDNEIIDIEIWEKTNGKLMDFIAKLPGTVNNEIVELNWIVEFDINNKDTNYAREIKEHGYTFIDYVFVIKYNDETVSSKPLIIMSWIKQLLVEMRTREPIRNHRFFLFLGKEEVIEGTTTEEGYILLNRIRKIGHYKWGGLFP
jgi:hypothetical protein